MLRRKLLPIALLTLASMISLMAQTSVQVYGTVTNTDGDAEANVNILVSALFADSTGILESVYTSTDGIYAADIPAPGPNLFAVIQVSMVDCQGSLVSQTFTILTGIDSIQADFVYCQSITIDSCEVIILEEWNPGTLLQLTAWTPFSVGAEFIWSTGESSQTIFPQTTGTYCVTATLPFGCEVTDCIQVNLDSTINCFAFIVSTTNGDGTYNLEVIASGTGPFTYSWGNGENSPHLLNVGPGTYCVVVVDSLGCFYTSCIILDDVQFCEVFISEGPNGGLFVNGYGLPPVSYLWSTGDTTQLIYPVQPGLYCVTMADNNGCTATSCYQYGLGPDSCFVFVNAFITDSNQLALQAIGNTGAMTWSYLWSTGEITETIYPQDLNQIYCVTMTDSDGCVAYGCFDSNLWCYAWVELQYVDTTTAILSVYTDPVFPIPGSDITYLWSTGATTPILTVTESGQYCVTVSIGQNCTTESCVFVDFEGLEFNCSAWVLQYQDSTGQWLAEALAWGWGTFSYAWSNGDTNVVTNISSPNENICVTVTSSFGCQAVACADTFFLPCEAIISVTYVSNTSAVLTAIVWNNPNQNASYFWNTGESGPVIIANAPGTYCVTVMGGGCVSQTCVEVIFSNVDSCGVWISTSQHPAGTAYTANGWGIPPFSYVWSNQDTNQTTIVDFGIHDLCVTVTDANGCTASGCNFVFDSCYVAVLYTNIPTPSLYVSIGDPIASVLWSTGDTMVWIPITEPGTYCAVVTTIFGCVTTACIYIDSIPFNEGQNVINGYVYADTLSQIEGEVELYGVQSNTGIPFALMATAVIGTDGYYSFTNLPNGVYLLRASLADGSPGHGDFIPTYHYSSVIWENANPHVLPNMLPVTTDIWLVSTADMNGSGVIGGVITDPQNIVADEGDEDRGLAGLPDIVVLLRDAQGYPLDYQVSLQDGTFRFTNLPWGSYRIRFDIAGLTSPDIWVTLSPEQPEHLQIVLQVEGGTVDVDQPVAEEILLFPNPAKHEVHIPVPGFHTTFDVRLLDNQGRVAYAGSVRNMNGIMTIDLSSFAPGMYQLQMAGDQKLYYGRFIKLE